MATTLRFLNRSPDLRIRLVWDQGDLLVVKEAEPGSLQGQALAREAQALQELAPLAGLPRLIGASEGHLTRQFLPCRPCATSAPYPVPNWPPGSPSWGRFTIEAGGTATFLRTTS